MKIELFYDKECPFCNYYANYIELKRNHDLILKNAREEEIQITEFKLLGFDINNGFIIKVDEVNFYQGADAIVFLNKLAKKEFFFPNNKFFRKLIYPSIKFFRKVVLLLTFKKVNL